MVIKNIVGEMNPYTKKKVERRTPTDQQAQKASKSPNETSDRVMLSPEARLRGAALQTASDAPDVRQKKVDDLKEQIRNGTYKPDLKKAAANLIRDDLNLLT